MRLPAAFLAKLPKDHLSVWYKTQVVYYGSVYDVLVAFDVFRMIIAVQNGKDVDQVSVDYEHLRPFTNVQKVIERAVEYGFANGFEEMNEDTTLEELTGDEIVCLIANKE